MTRPGGAFGADRPVTGTSRRGVPWGSDTTNDPNVSGPADRQDPAMRCSEPRWRLSEALDGQEPPMAATDDLTHRTGRCGVADESVEGVGRQGGRAPDGAVPHRGDAHPDGAVLRVLRHVRAQVGDRRRAGLDLRRGGTSDRHRPPDPRPAGARHVGDLRAHRHLPAQRQRLRLLLPADHAHGRHRRRVRPLRAHRPAAHRPVRRRLLPAQPGRSRSAPRSCGCSAGSRTCGRRSTPSPPRRR